jgi:hypothetical protein
MIRFAETPAAPVRVEPAEYDERLADEIAELAAHLHAATYRLLVSRCSPAAASAFPRRRRDGSRARRACAR